MKKYIAKIDLSEEIRAALEEEEGFEVGTAVFHKDFGKGVVKKSYQTSLGLTYDVYFLESHSTRTLVAKYAKFTTCS